LGRSPGENILGKGLEELTPLVLLEHGFENLSEFLDIQAFDWAVGILFLEVLD
jgi:hypothetical protein